MIINKKIAVLIAFVSCIKLNTFSQELKTVKKDSETYSYYENENLQIIRQGNYSYIKNNDGISYSLKGRYKDNLRHGLWTWYITMKDFKSNNSQAYETSIRSLKINYLNGIPDGNIIFSYDGRKRNKHWTGSYYTWSKFTQPSKRQLSVNVVNGKLAGSFKSLNITEEISGQFDSNGLPTGRFNQIDVIGNREPFSSIYKNGVVIAYTNQPANDTTLILAKEYTSGKIDSLTLIQKGYFLQRIKPINSILSHIKEMIYRSDLRWHQTPGDLLYDNGRISDLLTNGGKAYLVTKIIYKKLSDIQDYQSALRNKEKGEYRYAVRKLENVLQFNLNESEKQQVNKLYKECVELFKISEENRKEKERLEAIEKERERERQKKVVIIQQKIIKFYEFSSTEIQTLYYNKIATELAQKRADYLSSSMSKVTPIMKKKNLYNAYDILSKHYLSEIKQDKTLNEFDLILSKFESLHQLMKNSVNQNTKSIEKELKKINQPIELEKVLAL